MICFWTSPYSSTEVAPPGIARAWISGSWSARASSAVCSRAAAAGPASRGRTGGGEGGGGGGGGKRGPPGVVPGAPERVADADFGEPPEPRDVPGGQHPRPG